MKWGPFLRGLPATLREDLPAPLRDFRWSAYSYQAKAWYGNDDLHYEIWVRGRLRVVELGLHFEADDLTNARLLAAFGARAKDVKRRLGKDARIEEWDKGWARVWEPISLELSDEELRNRVGTRFADYMRVLEPIVRDELPSDVRWVMPAARRAAGPRSTSSRTSR